MTEHESPLGRLEPAVAQVPLTTLEAYADGKVHGDGVQVNGEDVGVPWSHEIVPVPAPVLV